MNISRRLKSLLPKSILRKMHQREDQKIKSQCTRYLILDITELEKYPIAYKIKDETWENVHVDALYNTYRAYDVQFRHEAQNIREITNAIVSDGADIVITSKGVVWDKYYYTNFTKITPLDRNMYTHENGYVWLKNYEHIEHIQGKVISLLGVYGGVWAHFIVQYLSKLYYAEQAGLLNTRITILVSPIVDSNIKEIFDQYAAKYPAISFVEAQKDTYYKCEELYYMPSASHLDDNSPYLQTCDVLIPQIVQDNLKRYLVQPMIEKIKNNAPKHQKIYLVRRDTYRKLVNWKEIEQFFKEQGFYLVEGHNMSLLEKADLFYHAEVIAGPYSSAWTNTMFSNQAKGLMLVNIPRTIDSYQVTFAHMGHVDILQVTGYDIGAPDTHMDSIISLDRVKLAYQELINKQ